MIFRHDNFNLKEHNTFKIEAFAKQFIKFQTIADIQHIINYGELKNYKIFILGGGSNVLFTKNFEGIILQSAINKIEIINETNNEVTIKAGSGVVWDDFVKFTVDNNFYGAENLSLIPGTVGASPVQNIGAYGVEAKDIITKVECVDLKTGELIYLTNNECKFAYRNSIFKTEFKDKYIVSNVFFKLSKTENYKLDYGNLQSTIDDNNNLSLQKVREAIITTRQQKLPDTDKIGNAGSFFKNPIIEQSHFEKLQKKYNKMPFYKLDGNKYKIPAGWLIENAGWKQKTINNVTVYKNQALVIINTGMANGNNIVNFSELIINDISDKYGIIIEPEVIFL